MRKINRLLHNTDFTHVLDKGRKYKHDSFLVAMLPNQSGHLRAGVSVSHRVGDAVTRVRIRRQVRAMIGEMDIISKPVDLVIIPKPGFLKVGYKENLEFLKTAIATLDRRKK